MPYQNLKNNTYTLNEIKKNNDFLNTIYLKFYIFVIFYYYISKKTQAKHIEFSAIRTEYIHKIYRKFLKIFFEKIFPLLAFQI